MSVEKVKEFFKRLEDDEAFRDDFLKDETLEKGNTEAVCKAASAKGYEFSADDLKAAKEEMKDTELSHEQLDKVSGGVSCSSSTAFTDTCDAIMTAMLEDMGLLK